MQSVVFNDSKPSILYILTGRQTVVFDPFGCVEKEIFRTLEQQTKDVIYGLLDVYKAS